MSGAVDASGKPIAYQQRMVQQSLMKRIGGLPPNGVDFISVDGAANAPVRHPEHQDRVHGNRSRHPVRLLAVGRRLGQRLRRRGDSSTSSRRRPARTVRVPSRAAEQASAPQGGARAGRREIRLGQAAAAGPCARHRADGMPSAASSVRWRRCRSPTATCSVHKIWCAVDYRLGDPSRTRSRPRWRAARSTD